MTDQPNTTAAAMPAAPTVAAVPDKAANDKKLLLQDIRVKWGKFSEQELGDLKSNDDLVTQLVAKYRLEKDAAQRDADTMLKGRHI
jgi:hypothetical protein